jgi:Twin arginine targeting (Tat) protein translocase TatC
MTFWDHLDELKKILFRSLIVLVVLFVVIFLNKSFVFDTLMFAPTDSDFILYQWLSSLMTLVGMNELTPFSIDLINIELATQFFTHINVSFTFAFIVGTPFILYQIWLFVKPALYDNEKSATKRAFGFAAILFFIGVAVGYLFVFPLTFRFLGTYQVSELVANQISLKSYISMFTRLLLIMGLVFEMPALAAILSRLGIITKTMLKKYRKYAFVILLILAAVITPSGDAFTMMIVALPLYLLYEFSIAICRDIDKQPLSSV